MVRSQPGTMDSTYKPVQFFNPLQSALASEMAVGSSFWDSLALRRVCSTDRSQPDSVNRVYQALRFSVWWCLLAALVSGCMKRDTTVDRANRAGVLHLSIGSEPADLDPQTVTSTGDAKIIQALFEPLVSFDPGTLAPVPALAERWEI